MLISLSQTQDITIDSETTTGLFANLIILAYLFAMCYVADKTVQNTSEIAMRTYTDLDWYKMPVKSRKYVQLLIEYSQEERHFTGGGLISCNLVKFAEVRKAILMKTNSKNLFFFQFVLDCSSYWFLFAAYVEFVLLKRIKFYYFLINTFQLHSLAPAQTSN